MDYSRRVGGGYAKRWSDAVDDAGERAGQGGGPGDGRASGAGRGQRHRPGRRGRGQRGLGRRGRRAAASADDHAGRSADRPLAGHRGAGPDRGPARLPQAAPLRAAAVPLRPDGLHGLLAGVGRGQAGSGQHHGRRAAAGAGGHDPELLAARDPQRQRQVQRAAAGAAGRRRHGLRREAQRRAGLQRHARRDRRPGLADPDGSLVGPRGPASAPSRCWASRTCPSSPS
jgi:hypothetical protein